MNFELRPHSRGAMYSLEQCLQWNFRSRASKNLCVSLAKVIEKFAYWSIRSIHCNNFGDNYCIIILSYLRFHCVSVFLPACRAHFFLFCASLAFCVRSFARLAYAWHEIIMNYSFCWTNIFHAFSHKFRLLWRETSERRSLRKFSTKNKWFVNMVYGKCDTFREQLLLK